MKKSITFKDTEHSKVMEDYANAQLAKIEEFLANEPTPVFMNLVICPSKNHAHSMVELVIKTPHYNRVVQKEGPAVYQVLDEVIDTMYLGLHGDKDKLDENRKMVGRHDEFKKQR